ncbi:endoplasmic reticulum mannosyl-oligosaccharide 1,2-alpha-mannosidase-like [Toxotes jaculatrix]|uniref:endoplasmic reticulum mannosyl-oligosaccharide 1,2-alpha-mannosidase-like n=1 Tax=Toxotes jaculatrix TaxID=941984 RepID=UPI001B3A8E4F|nr:endoplasmic reticulum mannosyl-oligosaccharide 1,2-alpha-mannosidase-like [Toxotes jaculatrix]XP_040898825.1 endoplasmic reticulum mannosyl-oligosaccharide 1,2-alpha-mannosidase-like [Toxotes jaculatrix]XP_040898828.1 endoplasmic reticulum mannosyl-oligosaccharide 1,2-alpha-mannosidase-like [Toxotes jaculatrix]
MHPPSRQGYVSISFAGQGSYNNSKQWRRQSCWRKWKQLSRLQRSLILFILILLFICGIASYPTVTEHLRGLTDGERDTDSNSILRPAIPHVLPEPVKHGPPALTEQPSQVFKSHLMFS